MRCIRVAASRVDPARNEIDPRYQTLLLATVAHAYPEERAQVDDKYRRETLFFRNRGNGKSADFSIKSAPALQLPRQIGRAHV